MYTRVHFINLVSDIWEGGGLSQQNYKCLPSIQKNANDVTIWDSLMGHSECYVGL